MSIYETKDIHTAVLPRTSGMWSRVPQRVRLSEEQWHCSLMRPKHAIPDPAARTNKETFS